MELFETVKPMYKMGFEVMRTSIDLMKKASDNYIAATDAVLKQFTPGETYENVKKALETYVQTQNKIFENFQKLLNEMEKQQEEVFKRLGSFVKESEKKK